MHKGDSSPFARIFSSFLYGTRKEAPPRRERVQEAEIDEYRIGEETVEFLNCRKKKKITWFLYLRQKSLKPVARL